MSQENYLKIMIDSLQKKLSILEDIQAENEKQSDILSKPDFDVDLFDETMEAKDRLIRELQLLDIGFDSVYTRVKQELTVNKQKYADEIRTMQSLITQITEKGVAVQVSEKRNDHKLQSRFSGERQRMRQSKATVNAASDYYQTMMGTSMVAAQFLDQKQ